MKAFQKFVLASTIFLIGINTSFAKPPIVINGPASCGKGATVTYTYDKGALVTGAQFLATNATLISNMTVTGTQYSVNITWSSTATSGVVTFANSTPSGGNDYTALATLSVTLITCTSILTPTSIVNGVLCTGSSGVILSANAPATNYQVRWYTPGSNSFLAVGPVSGTSTYTTPTLSATTNYNVTAFLTTNNCESAPVTATATVITPQLPVAYPIPVLGNSTDTLYANGADYGTGFTNRWYTTSTGGTPTQGIKFVTSTLTSATTYYVSTYYSLLSPGCESGRTSVVATVPATIVPTMVTKFTVHADNMTTDAQLYTLPYKQADSTLIYFDGLSRPVQQVNRRASSLSHDIITPYEYDANGRTSKDYLPYVVPHSRTTASEVFDTQYVTSQAAFYSTTGDKIADDAMPYAKAKYELSPLGRVLEQGAVGQAWQPGTNHTQKVNYSFNTGATSNPEEEVRLFNSDASSSGYYAANTLSRRQLTDANGHLTITYTDGAGRTLAKKQELDNTISGTMVNYLETYYVYNDMGQLAYILPPKAVAQLKAETTPWSMSQPFLDMWCFQFTYDYMGRITQKKSPGQAATYIGYDTLNRPVLVQTGVLRTTNQWQFVKYDVRNRPVMAGLYTDNTHTTLAQIQTLLSGLYIAGNLTFLPGAFYETKVAGQSTGNGYTNITFPTANGDGSTLAVQNVSYYDNYDFDDGVAGDDYAYASQGITGEGTQARAVGLATGGKSLVLGTSTWLYSYVFYDNYNRTIQVRGNNQLSTAKDNLTTTVYSDTTRLVILTKTYHNGGGSNQITVVQKPKYDAKGRVTQINHRIYGASNQLLTNQIVAQYQYNELGQVVAKQLHYNDTTSAFVQTVDLRYNIRGWLTSINNAQLANDGGVTNSDTNDFFGMELLYNTADPMALPNTPSYNGNISAVKWKGAGNGNTTANERSYMFTYDKNDQMLSATFQKYGTSWSQESGTLNESMTYDHNGNVLSLVRHQNNRTLNTTTTPITVSNTHQTIDSLTYTYANGNQLSKVDDASGNTAGFNDGSNTTTEYTYDAHGNLTADANKGIDSIVYNTLGKARRIKFHNGNIVTYTYDAGGNKLSMASTVSGTTTTTSYVNGFVYNTVGTTNTLNFFSSPEGRVLNNNGIFEYQYAIADHLGNTRVVFRGATQKTQSVTAGFETHNRTAEASEFSNYPSSSHINGLPINAHSDSSSLYLNGGPGGQVGVAKSYQVYPGDQLSIQAYAKYNTPSGTTGNLTGFATALLGAFSLAAPATGEVGTPSAAINGWGSIIAGGYGDGTTDETDPKVFVTIVIFDKNYNFLDVAYQQLTSSGSMTTSYTIKEAGYAFMYVSNEQVDQTDVYFDDITMSYTPGQIIQNNEYYPFGLQTAESWTRSGTTNNFLYDQGSEVNTTTGYYDLPYRNYDPALGRFFQVDPLAHTSHTMTPYHYAGNNPVGSNDPTGLAKKSPFAEDNPQTGGNGFNYGGSPQSGNFEAGISGQLDAADGFEGGGSFTDAGSNYSDYGDVEPGFDYQGGSSKGRRSSVSDDTTPSANNQSYTDAAGYTYYTNGGKVYITWANAMGYANDDETGLVGAQNVLDNSENAGGTQNANYLARAQAALDDYNSSGSGSSGESESSPFYTAFFGTTAATGLAVDITKEQIEHGAVYATKAGAKAVSLFGYGVIGASYAVAWMQFSLSEGKPSDYARLGGATVITGSAFIPIPVAGPVISFGLGTADAAGAFEPFYQSFDTPGVPTNYLNIMLSLPK